MTLLILQLLGLVLIFIGNIFISDAVTRWGAKKTRQWKYGNILQITGLILSLLSILLSQINISVQFLTNADWALVLISFLTLILLAFYTYYTRQIAQSAIDGLQPTVSCTFKSGKNYYNLESIRQNPKLKYDTRCIVINYSKYNLTVFINLNLKVDGNLTKVHELYKGKEGWPLTSYQQIDGHFDIEDVVGSSGDKITIDLEVIYKTDSGKIYKNPVQNWSFDRKNECWKNNIGLAV